MSREPYCALLMLALSLPAPAAKALGLGDIRIDSALNEPLSAQIDIVGATRDELTALRAAVANREVFQRYNADRPAFLSSATFKVGMSSQGRPALIVHSSEAFTDPVVSFLVELRWGKSTVIREYSLLLDPAGFNSARQPSDAAVASAAPGSPATAAAPVRIVEAPAPTHVERSTMPADINRYTITAGDTLRGIARHAGVRSEPRAQRLMLAIFRANPNAFEGNINRMRGGAVLTMPTEAQTASISGSEAQHEVEAQMAAWRGAARPAALREVASSQQAPAAVTATPAPAPAPAVDTTIDAALKSRVQSLEQALDDMHKQLATDSAKIQDLKQSAALATALPAEPAHAAAVSTGRGGEAPTPILAAVAPSPALKGSSVVGPMVVTLGLLAAGFAYVRRRMFPRIAAAPQTVADDPAVADEKESQAGSQLGAQPAAQVSPPSAPPEAPPAAAPALAGPAPAPRAASVLSPEPSRARPGSVEAALCADSQMPAAKSGSEALVDLDIDTEALERSYLDSLVNETALDTVAMDSELNTLVMDMSETLDATELAASKTAGAATPEMQENLLDFNQLDLDATAQHVQMPSGLHDRVVAVERRTNVADALKAAIELDPRRSDLRIKLLETYYGAASTNMRSFMEVVRKLAREPGRLSADEWNKVRMMGREIAPGNELFAERSKNGDVLADCA